VTITQTIEIPADRRITLEIPREVPVGTVVLTFTPVNTADKRESCSVCAGHRDPATGDMRFNSETMAGIQEIDDMIAGKIPNTMKTFNSLDEMLADLDSDD
jgi:hypothetical protein